MIRYLLHRLRRHDTLASRDAFFLHFYHCWTCSKNWDGLFFHTKSPWTA